MEKICAVCLISLCALLLLRQYKPEVSALLRMAAACVCIGMLLTATVQLVRDIPALCGTALPQDMLPLMLKAFGLCLATELISAVCRDSGENGLAMWVEYAARVELLVLSLPLLRTLFDITVDLLGAAA